MTHELEPISERKQATVDETGRIYYDVQRRYHPAPLRPVLGTMTVPTTEWSALYYMEDMVNAALEVGEQLPEGAVFVSGQVFYTGVEATVVEEVRIKFTHNGATWVAGSVGTEPLVDYQNGQILWSPEDGNRPHISAILNGNELHVLFNRAPGSELQQIVTPPITKSNRYDIWTSQEIMVLERSAANGKRGQFWKAHPIARKHVYEEKDASHHVELALPEPEQYEDEATVKERMEALGKFIQDQDADFAFALLYICNLLAPPTPLPKHATAISWIDLEDVAEKIGWNPSKRSRAERAVIRAQIWKFIQYGDRATVKGQRTIPYFDKTGEAIPTYIESTVWRIMDKQRPEQTEMFGEAPVRTQIAIGKQWEPLLTHPRLAQYLPLGELLGSIPTKQVAGSWARVIGLVLAGLWRRKPQETLNKTLRVTRRELLMNYTPKAATVDEILSSPNPRRAVEYWRDALGILLEREIIAREGETTRTVADMLRGFSRKDWQEGWLNEEVLIVPGPEFVPHVETRAAALPSLKVKALPGAKRRGRPRKKREIDS